MLPKRHTFKLLFLSFLFAIAGIHKGNAQVSAYGFSQLVASYVPLTGVPTVAYAAPWDDTATPVQVTIPFSFGFDGSSYTQCYVSPNGFITFGTVIPVSANYAPLSNTSLYNGAASALGMDLISNGSPIVYDVVGTAPNRTFVIQWINAARKASPGNFNFQIRLNETTNSIEFSYGSCAPTGVASILAQVGLRGPSNVSAQGNLSNRQQGTSTPWFNATFTNTISFATTITSDTGYPDNGLYYKYTPAVTCVTPTGSPSNLIIGATTISDVAFTGNSFTAASPAPTNYLILRSTINVAPTSATISNRNYYITNGVYGNYTVVGNITNTTFNQIGLSPATTYYYWVIPYNNICTGAPNYNLTNSITASASTCFRLTTANAASVVGGNNFTASWNAVTGATGYAIDISTNSTFTAMLPGYTNLLLGSGVTSLPVTGLLPATTYYYRVRAFSAVASCLLNSATITVTTTCGYYSIPYIQNFDSFATGVLPTCFTRDDANADGFQWETQNINYASASRSLMIGKNPTIAMNDWFFTPGLNLTGGVSYRLFFRYNTGNTSSTLENLKVRLGNGASVVAMTETLMDLPNRTNSNFEIAIVDFLPVTSGIYYIGFQGYSLPNQSYLVIDDISVTISPTCFEPTDVTASAIGSNNLTLSWTAASPAPANGYEYYISTSSTPPTNTTIPTGSVAAGITSVPITGLQSSTFYYAWVRGSCSTSDKSVWSLEESFNTECTTPSITSTSPATRCGYGITSITAVPSSGAFINWFATSTDDTILATGNTFTTPLLSATTTYYAQAKAYGAVAKLGPVSPIAQGGVIDLQNYQSSVNFNVTSSTTLLSFDIFPMASGQSGSLILRNSANVLMATFPFTTSVSGGNVAQIIPINYLLASGNYSIYFSVVPTSGVRMNSTDVFYPYTSSVANILSNTTDNSKYIGLYNWKFTTECLSARVPVMVTVSMPPLLTISAASSSICNGTSSGLITVTGSAAYDSLVWSPSTGISGSVATGFIFNPTTTTLYTLTANQSFHGACGNLLTHNIIVMPTPPAVTVVPNVVTVCQNTTQSLNGGAGPSVTVPVFTENFNTATNNWVVENTSVGGDTNASQWTLRPNNYHYVNSLGWDVTFSSNDASQFYIANSDSQSGDVGTLTRTTLTSPNINLVGYTSAALGYWQYLRYVTGDEVLVEVSSDGGINWSTVKSYNLAQGAAANFAHDTVNLDSYLGNMNVKIRFNFTSLWGYAWALDNVVVTGVLATELTWTPSTNLYTDAAATLPYVAGTPIGVVYTKPTANITYTATITGANGCTQSGTSVVTLGPATQPGILASDQIICNGGVVSDIVLTGNIGNIIRWEYADDFDFTMNVMPIAITSNTLNMLQMGSFTTIRYFRAVVKNGICNQVFSNVVYVSFSSTSWDGTYWSNGVPNANTRAIFNGNYSSTANLYACSILVNSGNVVVNANHNFVVTNDVFIAGGSLVFENNSSLVQINNSVNTGNITYKRSTTPVKKYDYTYWSSPVYPQTLTGLSLLTLFDKYFKFDPTIGNWSNVVSSTTMDIGKGYIVRAPQNFNAVTPAVFNAVFTGTPNNGSITTPIVVSVSNYNLIGNPYPSALSADLFLSNALNTSIVDGTIYLWTHNTPVTNLQYSANDYAVYNYLGGTGTTSAPNIGGNNSLPNGKIASGQSFFIKGLTSGNATFLNSMRLLGNNSQFFRMNSATNSDNESFEKNRIWLGVNDAQGNYKQTLLGYSLEATYGIDRGYDGELLDETPVCIYTIADATALSIQGRPMPFQDTDEVPVGFHADASGEFTINLFDFDGLFTTQVIYIKDTQLNVIHELKNGGYSFTSNAGTFNSRFVLVFKNTSTLPVSNPNSTSNSIVLYKPNQELFIDAGTTLIKKLRIIDARGRLLLEKESINASKTSIDVGTTNQVLLIEITSIDGEIITKKYVD